MVVKSVFYSYDSDYYLVIIIINDCLEVLLHSTRQVGAITIEKLNVHNISLSTAKLNYFIKYLTERKYNQQGIGCNFDIKINSSNISISQFPTQGLTCKVYMKRLQTEYKMTFTHVAEDVHEMIEQLDKYKLFIAASDSLEQLTRYVKNLNEDEDDEI
jgi:hypothetical protein